MDKTTNFELQCTETVKFGQKLRIVTTLLLFSIVKYLKFDSKKLFIIIPILLFLFDEIDSEYLKLKNTKKCVSTLFYQKYDKIIDLLSYIFVLYLFGLDNIFSVFCIFRAFGTILFLLSGKSYFLMMTPDLMKEYLIYRYYFPTENKYLIYLIIYKFIFEVFWHAFINRPDRLMRILPENFVKKVYHKFGIDL
jgi:hypothetical protein